MSKDSNKKKEEQLKMAHGTAQHKLRKNVMFMLLQECGRNICYQCNRKIESVDTLSVEHKIPWLDSENPIDLFFDLNNIAFSHLSCNISAARQTKITRHPSIYSYKKGCRCKECTFLASSKRINIRNRNK